MGHGGQGVDVGHVAVGIAEGLGIDHLGVGLDGCLEGLKVVHVDDGVADALCGQRVGDEVERAAIEIVGSHDMVASLHDVLQGVGDGSGTAGHGQSGHAALKGCHAVFEHALGGVGQTAVDVAGIAQTEAVGGMLGVAEHVAGGLIDGHGTGIGGGVGLFLAHMQLQGSRK